MCGKADERLTASQNVRGKVKRRFLKGNFWAATRNAHQIVVISLKRLHKSGL